ncbi:hypothetical protein PILCRDRAFT_427372 [Piloderma croceum F 1598]|uniref:Uncharacterized protein n=1 Tax=Piloderma croceum (strain F 1598) TaxID=765440 RepID=A0A0C3BB48_PILCF|nr:hypothetical protein PILCRDRAFT_427372 [Piloderma croceum F 1598]
MYAGKAVPRIGRLGSLQQTNHSTLSKGKETQNGLTCNRLISNPTILHLRQPLPNKPNNINWSYSLQAYTPTTQSRTSTIVPWNSAPRFRRRQYANAISQYRVACLANEN